MNSTDLETRRAEIRRKLLIGWDVPCPVCQGSLHRVESERCPGCSARLDLRVGVRDRDLLAPWVTAVVGCSLSTGFMIPVILSQVVLLIRGMELLYLAGLSAALIAVVPVFYLIIRRRRFWMMEPARQWWTAIVLMGASIAVCGLVVSLVRTLR